MLGVLSFLLSCAFHNSNDKIASLKLCLGVDRGKEQSKT